ncbi:MAG: PQQ-binding-like beta-propeller repeat protein [Planctomycetaceae bacterium]
MNHSRTKLLLAFAMFVISSVVEAADWPRFRGERGSGTSDETGLPVQWSADENIAWKTPLPGYGASSPVTFGDKIYVTGYSGYGAGDADSAKKKELRLHVICLDRGTGQVRWDESIEGNADEGDYERYVALHGYASGSPAVNERGVFAFFGSSGVVAYDHNGKQLWQESVGKKTHQFGTGASPVLYRDFVIVNASVESDSLVALDQQSGKEAWQAKNVKQAWNTPILVEAGGEHPEIVLNAGGTLLAFSPETGDALWNYASGTKDYICPSAIAHEGIVYAVCGRRGTTVAVRAGGSGDVTETHQVWKAKGASNVPSPVFHDGHLYFVDDKGIANCLDAKTGENVYQERLPVSDKVYASLVAADGKLYCVTREKGTIVLAAKPKFEQLAHNVIEGDESIFNASPVVSQEQLLLRSDRFLYCIGK